MFHTFPMYALNLRKCMFGVVGPYKDCQSVQVMDIRICNDILFILPNFNLPWSIFIIVYAYTPILVEIHK